MPSDINLETLISSLLQLTFVQLQQLNHHERECEGAQLPLIFKVGEGLKPPPPHHFSIELVYCHTRRYCVGVLET